MAFISIVGTVKTGRRVGKRLGFPTINIPAPRTIKKADWGIYFSLVHISDKVYPAVTHLGPVGTFGLRGVKCESHLLTIKQDFYKRKVTKKLLLKIRPVETFPTIRALQRQIKKDVKAAQKFFGI